MAAINAGNPTILDVLSAQNQDGSLANVIELLKFKLGIVPEATWLEGNLETGHRITQRTGLPSIAWRRFNEGVSTSKSRRDQFDETCGMLEGVNNIDVDLVKLKGAAGLGYRMSEDDAYKIAMLNEIETGTFYHSLASNPERFNGLAPRYGSSTQASGGSQIIKVDAAASGADSASMWLLKWGPQAVHYIYPKNAGSGIERIDMGRQNVDDGTGKRFLAWQTNFKWRVGLAVNDYRSVVRICNIDYTTLTKTGSSLIQAAIDAYYQIFEPESGGRLAFYCNRQIAAYLHHQARQAATGGTLEAGEDAFGRPVVKILGIPVRITDALLNTESPVS